MNTYKNNTLISRVLWKMYVLMFEWKITDPDSNRGMIHCREGVLHLVGAALSPLSSVFRGTPNNKCLSSAVPSAESMNTPSPFLCGSHHPAGRQTSKTSTSNVKPKLCQVLRSSPPWSGGSGKTTSKQQEVELRSLGDS